MTFGKVELIGSVDKRNIGCVGNTIGRQSPFVGNVLSENVLDTVIGQISIVSFSNGYTMVYFPYL